jgi:two-component system, cell cycle sensor histidine kinase and response regulator CckA
MALALGSRRMLTAKRTILVVDDEVRILNVLDRFLSKHGYDVLLASDADAAMDIYLRQKERIDTVLLDINLSKSNGYDLFAKMKAANADVKVVVTSGYLDSQVETRLFDAGVKRAIYKPYRLDEMAKILGEMIAS